MLPDELLDLSAIRAEIERRKRNKFFSLFPETGPLRRELYVKHMEFFRAGNQHRERAFIAGNRVGKTITGAYETTAHLTGLYPEWWEGRRFEAPTNGWAAGDTNLTVRDIIQHELLGPADALGTGMIPAHLILGTSKKSGVAHAVDTVSVRHVTGGVSVLGLKSYAEGRANFQGTAKHFIWPDEEPPMDVWIEMLMRTMIVPDDPRGGIAYLTFTPLSGWSEVVDSFLGAKT